MLEKPGAPRAAGSRPDAAISIAEIQAKNIAMDWSEAIAISQALCEQLLRHNSEGQPTGVDPTCVFIDANGGLSVRPVELRDGRSAVQQVRELLRAMLPE